MAKGLMVRESTLKKILDRLVMERAIRRVGDRIWCDEIGFELENQEKKSKKASENASLGWQKSKQNQRSKNADAYRYQSQMSDVSEDGLSGRPDC
ncbi:hypothetical protein [Mesorhizobium sp.]|uniref:hypothetical protein n=1 Tax=Mesorhizobium sp. TaxID=1871066 RepID=UPI000FE9397D|nr:hypothetical protein [Mesorhizobium sp.]RWM39420.1 MAG: hypothetical protein EOR75_14695 [Mesorhizobium sp.]TJV49892.1 MAG: hypothetical protein E5Y01_21960 [Mesorhizobium sp.]